MQYEPNLNMASSEMSSLDVSYCILFGVTRLEVGKISRCQSKTDNYFVM